MQAFKYTVCSYVPNLFQPEDAFEFAVLAATSSRLVLFGVNLSAFGLSESNEVARSVIEQTCEIISRRVDAACAAHAGESGQAILRRVAVDGPSCIQFSPIKKRRLAGAAEERRPGESFSALIGRLFFPVIMKRIARAPLPTERQQLSAAVRPARVWQESKWSQIPFLSRELSIG